ncbi:uncharacterized protein BDR25DRAFT_350669 [Lindgomyces ingoldianus]|uniref:Uncharacterized protein n=1 Tax=Lindgomyces ingoldianus TaxID=673940 RepID=A0ACB6RAC8_9PLEO|nr:uncharacterized protein BDR25DRAFT_350669 [Lindgomyces ingoldianus]KAF2475282.1 hypothetical protein BDR25DRAFT_350669 [Lindgomyces ingoldianus]
MTCSNEADERICVPGEEYWNNAGDDCRSGATTSRMPLSDQGDEVYIVRSMESIAWAGLITWTNRRTDFRIWVPAGPGSNQGIWAGISCPAVSQIVFEFVGGLPHQSDKTAHKTVRTSFRRLNPRLQNPANTLILARSEPYVGEMESRSQFSQMRVHRGWDNDDVDHLIDGVSRITPRCVRRVQQEKTTWRVNNGAVEKIAIERACAKAKRWTVKQELRQMHACYECRHCMTSLTIIINKCSPSFRILIFIEYFKTKSHIFLTLPCTNSPSTPTILRLFMLMLGSYGKTRFSLLHFAI